MTDDVHLAEGHGLDLTVPEQRREGMQAGVSIECVPLHDVEARRRTTPSTQASRRELWWC